MVVLTEKRQRGNTDIGSNLTDDPQQTRKQRYKQTIKLEKNREIKHKQARMVVVTEVKQRGNTDIALTTLNRPEDNDTDTHLH